MQYMFMVWYEQNRQTIIQRLEWLRKKPDGILFDKKTETNHVLVLKKGSQIQLYFTDVHIQKGPPKLSGIMSRIDLDDPLHLLGLYTQAMMLTLLWQPEPKRVFVLGFGGGRLPLLFYHYFPECRIESVEIDNEVIELSKQYFGVEFDDRQIFKIQDGREYLEQQPKDAKYDILIVDAFTDAGDNPLHLNTKEFYALCSEHLTPTGVICVNLVTADPLFLRKVNTFHESFDVTYVFEKDCTYTLFGTNGEPMSSEDLQERAEKLQKHFQFSFPLAGLSKRIYAFDSLAANPATIGHNAPFLSDTTVA